MSSSLRLYILAQTHKINASPLKTNDDYVFEMVRTHLLADGSVCCKSQKSEYKYYIYDNWMCNHDNISAVNIRRTGSAEISDAKLTTLKWSKLSSCIDTHNIIKWNTWNTFFWETIIICEKLSNSFYSSLTKHAR